MLGKLLRHEWKAVWKVPTLLIGALMVASVMAGIPFLFPIWESDWIGLPLSAVMLMLLFFAAMIATSFGIVIYLTVRYYKSMYTDEGYLTHTLPVKGRDLLLSKTIVMSVWNLISGIAVFVAMMIFYVIMLFGLTTRTSIFTAEFMDALGELRELLNSPYFEGMWGFLASLGCMMLTGAVGGSLLIMGAINLGQMVRKHRILGAIGAYFGFYSVMQIIVMAIMFPMMLKVMFAANHTDASEMSVFALYTPMYFVISAVYAILAVGLYFLSEYLIRRQLELE